MMVSCDLERKTTTNNKESSKVETSAMRTLGQQSHKPKDKQTLFFDKRTTWALARNGPLLQPKLFLVFELLRLDRA